MVTGIVYNEKYLEHEQSPDHPESKERLKYTLDFFEKNSLFEDPNITLLEPFQATPEDVLRVHHPKYIELLRKGSETGAVIDADTFIPIGLFDIALLAAGGTIMAAKSVIEGDVENAFAMVRPPGHHAHPSIGAGFCYLNNIAIAVKWLRENGIERIMIIDWDAHHGDGTQDVFYEDNSVLFVSNHQIPLYPGTGYPEEVGKGKGKGYTVNAPLPPGAGDESYLYIFEEVIKPLAEEFRPQFIAISTGMDNHFTDHLTSLAITSKGYYDLMDRVVNLSKKLCNGNLFAVLEGGYSVVKGLPYTIYNVIAAMSGIEPVDDSESYSDELSLRKRESAHITVEKYVETVKDIHSKYWNAFK